MPIVLFLKFYCISIPMPKLQFSSTFSNDEALGIFGDGSPLWLQEVSASTAFFPEGG